MMEMLLEMGTQARGSELELGLSHSGGLVL